MVSNFCGENTYSEEIIAGSTGSIDLGELLDINLYPNPTSSEFFLIINGSTSMEIELLIYNAIGQIQMMDNFHQSGQTAKSYNLSGMASGTYFVKLNSEEGSTFRKLIVTPK